VVRRSHSHTKQIDSTEEEKNFSPKRKVSPPAHSVPIKARIRSFHFSRRVLGGAYLYRAESLTETPARDPPSMDHLLRC
jgi:hypothetical protein